MIKNDDDDDDNHDDDGDDDNHDDDHNGCEQWHCSDHFTSCLTSLLRRSQVDETMRTFFTSGSACVSF